jgi:RNA methyltransferase, TrmH family
MINITSSENPKIKEIVHLRKAGKRKKNNLFIIEGKKEISLAISGGIEIADLVVVDSAQVKEIKNLSKSVNLYQVTETLLKKITLRENADGFLAIAKMAEGRCPTPPAEAGGVGHLPLILVLEGIEKPGNLGAILRSADAAGVDKVILIDPKTDIYNPNVIRASLGTVFTVKITICTRKEAFEWLKNHKINCFAATPEAKKLYTNTDFRQGSAIFIGTEHEGLSSETLSNIKEKIKIPMQGKIDSLNASVSAAILIFEANRQRNISEKK